MATVTQGLNDLKAGYKQTVNTLGTDFTLKHLDDTTEPIRAHVIPAGKEDTAIINALGVDTVFLHALETPLIKKFEILISPSTREYVVEASHELFVNNVLVGQKIIAR